MEAPISLHQFHSDRRVIKARQSAGSHGIEKLLVEQLLANGPQVGGAVVNQRLQRGFASADLSVLVERNFPHRLKRAAVAKEHAEVPRALAKAEVSRISQLPRERVPGSGLGGLAPADQTIGHAVENVGLKGCGLRRAELEQIVQRPWTFLD